MSTISQDVLALLLDSEHANLHVKCRGRTFKGHWNIVCRSSNALAEECGRAFTAAGITVLQHHDFDASTVGRMLQFIYHGDYTVTGVQNPLAALVTPDPDRDTIHNPFEAQCIRPDPSAAMIDVYQSIVTQTRHRKYSFEELRLADYDQKTFLLLDPTQTLLSHIYVYTIATQYQLPGLTKLALQKIKHACDSRTNLNPATFVDVVLATYDNETPELCTAVLAIALKHHKVLLADSDFKTALTHFDFHQFIVDFIAALSKRSDDMVSSQPGDIYKDATGKSEDDGNKAQASVDSQVASDETSVNQDNYAMSNPNGFNNTHAAALTRTCCRTEQCKEPFNFSVEEWHGYWIIRCNDCRAKHFPGWHTK